MKGEGGIFKIFVRERAPIKILFRKVKINLQEVKNYLTPEIDVRRGDVLSAWSGIRPLVKDPNAEDTQSLGKLIKHKSYQHRFVKLCCISLKSPIHSVYLFRNRLLVGS